MNNRAGMDRIGSQKLRTSNRTAAGGSLPRFMAVLAMVTLQEPARAGLSMRELAKSGLDLIDRSGPWNLL